MNTKPLVASPRVASAPGRHRTIAIICVVTLFWANSRTRCEGSSNPPLQNAIRGTLAAIPPEQQKRVDVAIDAGVAFLKRTQNPAGAFGDGVTMRTAWPVGFAALPGLALLECGVPAKDAAVQKAASFIRKVLPSHTKTYEISLGILFLDRLGEREDRALIRSLALRLAAGQTPLGGWSYHCPIQTADQEKKLLESLSKQKDDELKPLEFPKTKGREAADNSNTQFAILALCVARRHELPVESVLAKAEQRFRATQRPSGWGYVVTGARINGSMTCAGLLALGAGRASVVEKDGAPDARKADDEGMRRGFMALAESMNDPADSRLANAGKEWWGPEKGVNLYFLWSVERVGVLCGLDTIGGRDWYRWGVDLLLPSQNKDGSWTGRGNGGATIIDTSMALLFLKRSDLLPDLRKTLQQRVNITDPGPDGKGVTPKKSPGEKSLGGKSPGERRAAEQKDKPVHRSSAAPLRFLELRGWSESPVILNVEMASCPIEAAHRVRG